MENLLQEIAVQKTCVVNRVYDFLKRHWERKRPLLLGYSGGPDSKALLYALLECDVIPHIAHVDHGWREESREEAQGLEEEAKKLGCPFLSVRLNLKEKKEDEARKARYSFFASVFSDYEALLLAHQMDDLAETVLKRVLEGAHLAHLGGMQPISQQYGMTLWRPLLSVRRQEILQFLQERSLDPLIDPANSDPIYLRSRMREEIFPFLNETFGKRTEENLALLSERAFELKAYLDQQTKEVPVQKGPWGLLADLTPLKEIERRHLLQKMARDASITLSREMIETLLKWIGSHEKSRILDLKTKKILVDEGRVWLFSIDPKGL